MNLPREKISFFEKKILAFYRKEGRKHLPWRKKDITLYEVWVSEIMLQQTQVDRVVGFYVKFLKKFPTISSLAKVSWEEFLPHYQGLGYYNRGRNMLATARTIREKYKGVFPKDIETLETLPGIGKYTARAIVSFGNNADYLAWDTNFARVFGRFFFGSKDTEIDSMFFERKMGGKKRDFNGAVMDFGSLVCIKKPKCEACPLASRCKYMKERGKKEIQIKKKRAISQRDAIAVVILHRNHREYFSSVKSRYSPFIVPDKKNSRLGIKQYFKKKYNLDVSVRPPHKRGIYQRKPAIFVYAQILLGVHSFCSFEKGHVYIGKGHEVK